MTDLIACLSTGKGTWEHVARVINCMEWNNIFLITNEFNHLLIFAFVLECYILILYLPYYQNILALHLCLEENV